MSELAIKLIRENKAKRKSGEAATFLDLGNTGLREIPNELFDLVWLETLILSNNYEIWDVEKREWINKKSISNGRSNYIETIPQGFRKLNKLNRLYLAGDEERKWGIKDTSALNSIVSLEELYLGDNIISNCDNLVRLINIKFLELDSNDLQDINFIQGFEKLSCLSISGNNIGDINIVKQLKNIEFLYFRKCKIKNLEALVELPKLTRLFFADNPIQDFTPLYSLEKLKFLGIWDCKINDFNFLKSFIDLEVLYMGNHEELTELEFLSNLKHLKKFGLYKSKISDFSQYLANHKKLKSLYLRKHMVNYTSKLSNNFLNCRFPVLRK